jgi:hypothetical protein
MIWRFVTATQADCTLTDGREDDTQDSAPTKTSSEDATQADCAPTDSREHSTQDGAPTKASGEDATQADRTPTRLCQSDA